MFCWTETRLAWGVLEWRKTPFIALCDITAGCQKTGIGLNAFCRLLDLWGLCVIFQLPPAAKQGHLLQTLTVPTAAKSSLLFSLDFLLKETTSPLLQALLELKLPPLQKALELEVRRKNPVIHEARPATSYGSIWRKWKKRMYFVESCFSHCPWRWHSAKARLLIPNSWLSTVKSGQKQRLVMWTRYMLHSKLPLTVSPLINVCKL